MSFTAVLYEKEGPLAIVALNRPKMLNAYNIQMRDDLYQALRAVRDDPEVRVMILRGEGPAFSTGGDVSEFGSAPSPIGAREIRWRRDVWGTLLSLPSPLLRLCTATLLVGAWKWRCCVTSVLPLTIPFSSYLRQPWQ